MSLNLSVPAGTMRGLRWSMQGVIFKVLGVGRGGKKTETVRLKVTVVGKEASVTKVWGIPSRKDRRGRHRWLGGLYPGGWIRTCCAKVRMSERIAMVQ